MTAPSPSVPQPAADAVVTLAKGVSDCPTTASEGSSAKRRCTDATPPPKRAKQQGQYWEDAPESDVAFNNVADSEYRGLISAFDWASVYKGTDRMLDCGVGTGRCQTLFLEQARALGILKDFSPIVVDLIDSSQSCLTACGQNLQPPFRLGNQYHSKFEAVDFVKDQPLYDCVQSLHGMYEVPCAALGATLLRITEKLKPEGKLIIVQGTKDSHYARWDRAYLKDFPSKTRVPFNVAEDIEDVLKGANVPYERIPILAEHRATFSPARWLAFLKWCVFCERENMTLKVLESMPNSGAYLATCGQRKVVDGSEVIEVHLSLPAALLVVAEPALAAWRTNTAPKGSSKSAGNSGEVPELAGRSSGNGKPATSPLKEATSGVVG